MKKFIVTLLAVCLIAIILVVPVSASTLDNNDWKWSWDWNNVIDWFENHVKSEVNDTPPTETEEPKEPEIEEAEPVVEEYTIRYDANGGYWWSQYASPAIRDSKKCVVDAGESHTLIAGPIRTGYTFIGWKTDLGDVLKAGDTITPKENMKLKAVWG